MVFLSDSSLRVDFIVWQRYPSAGSALEFWPRLALACVSHCWSRLTLGTIATRRCTNSDFLLSYVVFSCCPSLILCSQKVNTGLRKIYMLFYPWTSNTFWFACVSVCVRVCVCLFLHIVYSDVFLSEIHQMLWAPRGSPEGLCRPAESKRLPRIIDWNKRHIYTSVSKLHTDTVRLVCSVVFVFWWWWWGGVPDGHSRRVAYLSCGWEWKTPRGPWVNKSLIACLLSCFI